MSAEEVVAVVEPVEVESTRITEAAPVEDGVAPVEPAEVEATQVS